MLRALWCIACCNNEKEGPSETLLTPKRRAILRRIYYVDVRVKNVVKLLLEDGSFLERPAGLFLVTKQDTVENGLGYSQQRRKRRVQLGAFVRQTVSGSRVGVRGPNDAVELLEGKCRLIACELHGSNDDGWLIGAGIKSQLDGGFCLFASTLARICRQIEPSESDMIRARVYSTRYVRA